MSRAIVFSSLCLALFGGACQKGTGSLVIDVGASSTIHDIDHFEVSVSNGGEVADPVKVTLAGGPADVPPVRRFTLVFQPDRSGATMVKVTAFDLGGDLLGVDTESVEIAPGAEAYVEMSLSTTVIEFPFDAGFVDEGEPPFPVDLAFTPDFAFANPPIFDMTGPEPVDLPAAVFGDLGSGPVDAATSPADSLALEPADAGSEPTDGGVDAISGVTDGGHDL